jgi:hypothetical protein
MGPIHHLPAFTRATPGSYPAGAGTFASLRHFLAGDPRRTPSRERDVGLYWRDAVGHRFRAAWVVDTGELVVVQVGAPETGGGHVEVLATVRDEKDLRHGLAGWEDVCGEPRSAEWLRRRAAALASGQRELAGVA